MILCAPSTPRSSEQITKRRSRSENVWKVCLFYSHNNKILWLSNIADTFNEKFTRCAKVYGFFPLDCAFRTLIGWAGKLWSHGLQYYCRLFETWFPRSLDFWYELTTQMLERASSSELTWNPPRTGSTSSPAPAASSTLGSRPTATTTWSALTLEGKQLIGQWIISSVCGLASKLICDVTD